MYFKNSSLIQLTTTLRTGDKNIFEYINETCDLIEKADPHLQALLPEPKRRERLLEEARQLEDKYPNKEERPALYGGLVGVKDIFSVEGFSTQAGSKLPAELFNAPEALCVTKLKKQGALILGKTVTTEFAHFHPGPTRNPHNLEHTPGGSSSGSAAAVAAGFCPLALGTQTIGSIIRPGAYCGIVGFKPTFDRISTDGLVYFSKSSDHVGLFTQDVESMIVAARVLCNNWDGERLLIDRLPVLGVPEGPYLIQASPEALAAFEENITCLKNRGYQIKRFSILEDIEEINERHKKLGAAEMARAHTSWYKEYKDLYSFHSVQVYEKGEKISDDELKELQTKPLELRTRLAGIMDEAGIDLWISPATTETAPKGLESTGNPIMNLPWTHAGLPVINLPAGKAANGLPWGLQIVAKYMQDEKLIFWSQAIQKCL